MTWLYRRGRPWPAAEGETGTVVQSILGIELTAETADRLTSWLGANLEPAFDRSVVSGELPLQARFSFDDQKVRRGQLHWTLGADAVQDFVREKRGPDLLRGVLECPQRLLGPEGWRDLTQLSCEYAQVRKIERGGLSLLLSLYPYHTADRHQPPSLLSRLALVEDDRLGEEQSQRLSDPLELLARQEPDGVERLRPGLLAAGLLIPDGGRWKERARVLARWFPEAVVRVLRDGVELQTLGGELEDQVSGRKLCARIGPELLEPIYRRKAHQFPMLTRRPRFQDRRTWVHQLRRDAFGLLARCR